MNYGPYGVPGGDDIEFRGPNDRRERNQNDEANSAENFEVESQARPDRSDRKGVKGEGKSKGEKGGKARVQEKIRKRKMERQVMTFVRKVAKPKARESLGCAEVHISDLDGIVFKAPEMQEGDLIEEGHAPEVMIFLELRENEGRVIDSHRIHSCLISG